MNLNLFDNKYNSGPQKPGEISTKELARRWGKSTLTILRYRDKGLIEATNKQSPFGKTHSYYFDLKTIEELEKQQNPRSN